MREVAQAFAAVTCLLGVKPQMVRIAQHLFEHQSGLIESGPLELPRPGHSFYEPERTNIKCPFLSSEPILSASDVVSVNQTVGHQTSVLGGLIYRIQGAEQPGGSKERIFESTLVILTPKRQRPERKENKLRHAQAKRQEAKSLRLCVACGAPPIPDQTRCFSCAEVHRQSRRRSDAKRKAMAKAMPAAKE